MVDVVSASAAPLLAFDTSTEALVVAVCGPAGGQTLIAAGGAAASAHLLPQALQLLAQAHLTLQDLRAIAFGSGPGAFTGLRTACAVAQGLGLGLSVPLLPLDSLLLVAEDARLQAGGATNAVNANANAGAGDFVVVMDARMNEVYAGVYRWLPNGPDTGPAGGLWQALRPPALYDLDSLAQVWNGLARPVVAGSALAAFGHRLLLPADSTCFPTERNRGAALLRLAQRAWAAGQGVDAAQALPFYGRDKVAQTTQERAQAREKADEQANEQALKKARVP